MAVCIRRAEDGTIRVEFPFDYERVGRIKRIPGSVWIASLKEWRLPGDRDTVIKIAELFGEDDVVFGSGSEWFMESLMNTPD